MAAGTKLPAMQWNQGSRVKIHNAIDDLGFSLFNQNRFILVRI
jgi:hypothetical protein